MWELDSAANVMEVLIPFQHLGLVCSQMGTHKTHGRRVDEETDNHTPFVPRLP